MKKIFLSLIIILLGGLLLTSCAKVSLQTQENVTIGFTLNDLKHQVQLSKTDSEKIINMFEGKKLTKSSDPVDFEFYIDVGDDRFFTAPNSSVVATVVKDEYRFFEISEQDVSEINQLYEYAKNQVSTII